MPAMSAAPPLRFGPRSGRAHAAVAAALRSVGGSNTPASCSASSTSRGWGATGLSPTPWPAGGGRSRNAKAPLARSAGGSKGAPLGDRRRRHDLLGRDLDLARSRGRWRSHGGSEHRGRVRSTLDAPRLGLRVTREAGLLGQHVGIRRRRRERRGWCEPGQVRQVRKTARCGDGRLRTHAGGLVVARCAPLPLLAGRRADVHGRGAVAHRVQRRSHGFRRGVRHLGRDGASACLRLHGPEDAGPLEPQLRVGVPSRPAGWPARGPSRPDRRRHVAAGTRPASGRWCRREARAFRPRPGRPARRRSGGTSMYMRATETSTPDVGPVPLRGELADLLDERQRAGSPAAPRRARWSPRGSGSASSVERARRSDRPCGARDAHCPTNGAPRREKVTRNGKPDQRLGSARPSSFITSCRSSQAWRLASVCWGLGRRR